MMKNSGLIFLLLGFIFSVHFAWSQAGVGIGVIVPHQSAVLHIQAPTNNKGLLIPRIGSVSQLGNFSSPAKGLLVYDSVQTKFYFHNGTGWYSLNEMVQPAGSSSITHSGDLTIAGNIAGTNLSATGTVTAANYGLNATGNGPVPKGGIIMWSGSPSAIPTGWALCNGAPGTPDLRGRFIVGYDGGDADYNVIGKNAGEKKHVLVQAEIPAHVHAIPGSTTSNFGGGGAVPGVGVNTDEGGGNTYSTGGGLAHENRPPYYTLAYIIKL